MHKIKALNLKSNEHEIYYCSNTIPLDLFKEHLSYIKQGHKRDWVRSKREIIETHEDHTISFRNEMKYICTINEEGNKEIFIFDKHINHDYFYEVFRHIDEQFRKKISAGFTNGITCYGRSETLNLDSNPEDFKLII